jgi:hypothetical protein
MLAGTEWRDIRWRSGTTGSLSARFAALRIRVADATGAADRRQARSAPAW